MADIFREIDEELRRDSAAKLWKKYGYAIIGLAVAVVLTVAGIQAWRAYDLSQRSGLSDRYAAALESVASGNTADGLNGLADISEPEQGGYPGLAALSQAQLLVRTGDTAGAIAVWDRISADSAMGAAFQGVATLQSILHQIDEGDPQVLNDRLAPLAAVGQAFRASALELQAVLALRQNDSARARELYTIIADDREAPSGLRARAAQMLTALKE